MNSEHVARSMAQIDKSKVPPTTTATVRRWLGEGKDKRSGHLLWL